MVIREAFALGVPVAASRIGSIPCIVEDGKSGVLFRPGDKDKLLARVKSLWGQADKMAEMGKAARTEFERNYTSDANFRQLMAIYAEARLRRQTT